MIMNVSSLMRDLLAKDGNIFVHCDTRLNSYVRLVLDEVFGKDNSKMKLSGSAAPAEKQFRVTCRATQTQSFGIRVQKTTRSTLFISLCLKLRSRCIT